jgi:hypothetical protein
MINSKMIYAAYRVAWSKKVKKNEGRVQSSIYDLADPEDLDQDGETLDNMHNEYRYQSYLAGA